jgi:hypothetical protein
VLLDGLTPNCLVKLLCEKPMLAFHNYTKLLSCIEDIETSTLEKLCEIFDPSQPILGSIQIAWYKSTTFQILFLYNLFRKHEQNIWWFVFS